MSLFAIMVLKIIMNVFISHYGFKNNYVYVVLKIINK